MIWLPLPRIPPKLKHTVTKCLPENENRPHQKAVLIIEDLRVSGAGSGRGGMMCAPHFVTEMKRDGVQVQNLFTMSYLVNWIG